MWIVRVYRITPRQVIVVAQVVVAPRQVLSFWRINVVTPREVVVGGPVRNVAVEDALGGKQADWIGQTNEIEVAPLQLTRIEKDARQLEKAQETDAAAAVQAILQLPRIPERHATGPIEEQVRQRRQQVRVRLLLPRRPEVDVARTRTQDTGVDHVRRAGLQDELYLHRRHRRLGLKEQRGRAGNHQRRHARSAHPEITVEP